MGEYDIEIGEPTASLQIQIKQRKEELVSVEGGYERDVGFFGTDGKPLYPGFIPCRTELKAEIASMLKRSGSATPEGDKDTLAFFARYAKHAIEHVFTPPTTRPTFEEWLERSKYSGGRKRDLQNLRSQLSYTSTKKHAEYTKADAFIKWETYMAPKIPRTINALLDEVKVIYGPTFHAVDKATFAARHGKWFIKGTAPHELPLRMQALFGTSRVMETDFSSFESHHRGVMIGVVRHWMMHMTRNFKNDEPRGFFEQLSRIVLGENTCKFKHSTAKLDETLMSGASWTSSSNGLLNFMLMSFITLKSAHPSASPEELVDYIDEFKGLIEGDDGICAVPEFVDETLITKLGLRLKFEYHPRFGDANFCGILMSDSGNVITDPKKFIRKFFILPPDVVQCGKKKRMAYLRCKALSALTNYRDCPIVGMIAYEVCKMTSGYDVEWAMGRMSAYERETTVLADPLIAPTPTPESRDAVRRRFGYDESLQLMMESGFENKGCVVMDTNTLTRDEMYQRENHIHDSKDDFPLYFQTYHDPPSVLKIIKDGKLVRLSEKTQSQLLTKRWDSRRAEPLNYQQTLACPPQKSA